MMIRSLFGTSKARIVDLLGMRRHSTREVAAELEIQVNAARKHLESLKEKGLVREEYQTGGVGRPKKFYSLTGIGRELLQNQSTTVLNLLLEQIEKKYGKSGLEDIVRPIATEIGTSMRAAELDEAGQLEYLASSLDRFGFETKLEEDETTYAIISCHCPLKETAVSHQKLMCHAFHDEILRSALLRDDIKLAECMVLGGNVCKHVISKK